MISEKYLIAVEFDKLKKQAAEFCALAGGKKRMLEETPRGSYEEAEELLNITTEATDLLYVAGASGIEFYDDPEDIPQKAAKGFTLSPGDLLKCARFLRSGRILKDSVLSAAADAPRLKAEASGIFVDKYAEDQIFSKILGDDTISDNASEKLYSIRKNILRLNEQIRDKLQSFIRDGRGEYLQENIVTVRGDRFVLPVKSEYGGKIGGFVHDRSATGSTVFIEPTAVFEMNNALKTAKLEEQAEIDRILTELSRNIGNITDKMAINADIMEFFDVAYAKAVYAYKTNSVRPALNSTGKVSIKNGRHPLIAKDKVVPVSLSFGDKYKYLLISGPNTGGKTVCLKMTGLFAAMAACGMFLPASQGTEISFFDKAFCDVGDEQSIENSLSTFSSHIKNVIDITESADGNSLVLIDELGAGTDPDEGSALARAIIERLMERGSCGIITTHYSSLKEFAYSVDGIENASMEFDPETYEPLYKINIGFPGTSNALEISMRLGLSEDIAKRAYSYLDEEKVSFERVLKEAEKTRKEAEILKIETEKLKELEVAGLREINEERDKLEKYKEKLFANAKAESRRIISERTEEADEIIEEMKSLFEKEELTSGDLIRARTLRNSLERKKYDEGESEEKKTEYEPVSIEKLSDGDKVYYKPMDAICAVGAVNAKKGEAEVFVGSARVMAKAKDLFFVSSGAAGKTTVSFKRETASLPVREINVIGKTSSEAIREVEDFLDAAVVNNLDEVKIIHGKGRGVLGSAIHELLKKDSRIKEYRYGKYGEGETGVTIVKF